MAPNQDPTSIKRANILLGLQFLTDFGDQITSALLALLLLDTTQSAGKIGFVYFITTLGYVVFTLVGGVIGDRLSRRNILFYSDLGRGFVVLLMIIALKEKSIFLIYCTSFLLSVLGSLHRPVKLSAWTESIPETSLEKYNSLSELSIQASTIVGPLIASFFIMREWTSFGFALDAATFFVCAIVFAQIISRQNQPTNAQPISAKKELLKGFAIILKERTILKYVGYDAIQMMGFGAFNATFLVLAQRDFAWSKSDYSFHLVIIAMFTIAGALMGATKIVERIDQNAKLISCALISAIALGVMLKVQSFPMSSILFGICDGLAVMTMAVTRTKVQLIAKEFYPNFLSSIIASRYIIIKAATLFGTGACLLIDDFISLESTLFFFIAPIGLSCAPLFSITKKPMVTSIMPSAVKNPK